ncbi:hypothetical protein AVEN_95293-1 [Araneus ventricosus]|uniref:Uncharacterized protein n=1 Tax=Araneus ventricosus TaxID=182803 RepID=A0A4Y2T5Z6_ARAVE|nr:hypothetical protein AVEN_95293-1 [Araneus ventricosus]
MGKHNQELTIEELMELHCVSQQEVMEKSLSEEEEEVTAKQQSSSAIREMLKAWKTDSSSREQLKVGERCICNLVTLDAGMRRNPLLVNPVRY